MIGFTMPCTSRKIGSDQTSFMFSRTELPSSNITLHDTTCKCLLQAILPLATDKTTVILCCCVLKKLMKVQEDTKRGHLNVISIWCVGYGKQPSENFSHQWFPLKEQLPHTICAAHGLYSYNKRCIPLSVKWASQQQCLLRHYVPDMRCFSPSMTRTTGVLCTVNVCSSWKPWPRVSGCSTMTRIVPLAVP